MVSPITAEPRANLDMPTYIYLNGYNISSKSNQIHLYSLGKPSYQGQVSQGVKIFPMRTMEPNTTNPLAQLLNAYRKLVLLEV